MIKNLLFDKKLVFYDDPRNSPEATFTQVPNWNPIKPVLFLGRKFACVHRGQSVFVPVLALFTRVHNRIGRKHFPPKQPKKISVAYKIRQTLPNNGVNMYC